MDEADLLPASTFPSGKGETILLVDDEPSYCRVLRQTLEEFNYRVLIASDGLEAVAIYTKHLHEIDAVLTDMMMPNMDGADTIHALRALNPAVRIIAASGIPLSEAMAGKVTYFLQKPFATESLLLTLQDALAPA